MPSNPFKNLTRGYAKIIANKLKCSERHVYNVRAGNTTDNKIELALLEMALREKKIKKRRDALIKKINAL